MLESISLHTHLSGISILDSFGLFANVFAVKAPNPSGIHEFHISNKLSGP